MKECKCKCGGCAKKGGGFMLETIFVNGGYTYEQLENLWGKKYYEYLLNIYSKLINNLEDSNKVILLILNIITLLSIQDIDSSEIKKLHSLFNFLSIHDVNYLYQAIADNIHMEPFFVLRMANCHNFVYSNSFTEELLNQNTVQYNLYISYLKILANEQYVSDFKMASAHSSYKSTIVSFFSGYNLDFVRNNVNWSNHSNVISAHVIITSTDYDSGKLRVLMLSHKPSSVRGELKETDCRLGPPGGIIDKTDKTPWDAMIREYHEEAGCHFPSKFDLINTFIWKKKHVVFVVNTESRIANGIVNNDEIYSRKWFNIDELKKIIESSKHSKQVKGKFKMRNGAIDSTIAIIDFMSY
jgi:8-oxo-dGTP pyrophosphatase MutT (NUDIX family)